MSIDHAVNVAVFGFKAENGNSSPRPPAPFVVWITHSQQVSLFGVGGSLTIRPNDGTVTLPLLYRIDASTDFRLVSLIDRLFDMDGTNNMIVGAEQPSSGAPIHTQLLEPPILYARDATQARALTACGQRIV